MLLIQQITSIFNINLLYFLSSAITITLFINHILRNTFKSNYYYWICYLFIISSFFITISFQASKALFALALFFGLFTLSLTDIFYRILPNIANFLLLILGLILSLGNQFIPLTEAISGVFIGYFVLWVISLSYQNITGQVGIGKGDLKLTAALGAWVGGESIPYVLFWSSLLGCAFYLVMVVIGRYDKSSRIPFGLFLSVVGMSIFIMRFSLWHL